MSWIKKLLPSVKSHMKRGVPDGVWVKCPECAAILYKGELTGNLHVCLNCSHHFRLKMRERINMFFDKSEHVDLIVQNKNPDKLHFKDVKKYSDRLHSARKKTSENDACVAVKGKINGLSLIGVFFNFDFIGGSMGVYVGNCFVKAVEEAIKLNCPLVCFSMSGGARMQENVFSLLQMSKTSSVLVKLSDKKLPYISVLLDPTTGGVCASIAMLGDIIIAEPKALIGFSGRRVIEQTIGETLPAGFQRSEFLLAHGGVDMIVDRRELKGVIHNLLLKLLKKRYPN